MAVTFFISYKRGDAETERLLPLLRTALSAFRYRVFVDVDIDPGTNWEDELRGNIECADEFLLLLSAAAAESERVEDEVRMADTFRNSKNRKPRLLPVYINVDELQNPALKRILDPIERLTWRSEADTPRIVARIRAMVRKRRRLGVIATAAAAALVALLLVLFVHSMMQIGRLRSARSSVPDVLAAYGRLRADERLLAPHLWLVGRWRPEALAAQALDEHAVPLLASPRRNDVELGLMLSAQAAVLRGGNVTTAAQRVYDGQHYELLVTSMAAREEIAGRSLAVSANAADWRIAVGGRIWRCAEPIGQRPCAALPSISRQAVVVAAAFDSHETLRLVGYSGDVTTLDLRSGEESSLPVTEATFVAVDEGDVAISFDHGNAGGSSVRVDPAGPALRPRNSNDLGRLTMAAFGPCDGCVSTLGRYGAVTIWRWSPAGAGKPIVLPGTTLLLAASRPGHRLALISNAGDLTFYGADARPEGEGPSIDLTDAESMAMSPDGRHLAVVHGGNVTLFEDGAAFRTLIAATRQPKVIAVAFAGNDYLVTRTPNDARVWRLRSAERRDPGPEQRWAEWGKKFGLAGSLARQD